jgi:hypothetical protein
LDGRRPAEVIILEVWIATGAKARMYIVHLLHGRSGGGTAIYGMGEDGQHSTGVTTTLTDQGAKLNPICHLLILLGDLSFMGPCIVSIFQYTCISNKMQHYTVYLYVETALRVSGGTSAHHKERIQLYLQHLVFVTPLLLSVAIVEELEPV